MSEWVAQYVHQKINNKGKFVLGLPTGSTPIEVYQNLIKLKTNFEQVTTFNMDEYIGLPPDHPQSYHYFMNKYLFDHINIDKANINIPNGIADDLNQECHNYEQRIKDNEGINLFLCGIGQDGHIAFNEPGSSFNSTTRIKTLTSQTIKDNSRFFNSIQEVPKTAITVGLKTVSDSDEIIIMASGLNKSKAVKECIEGSLSNQYPCTIAKNHSNATIIIDYDAASELTYKTINYYLDLQKSIDINSNYIEDYINKHISKDDNVLITSPHPDDDVIGMGGSMDILPNKSNVKILYMTNGEGGLRKEDNYGTHTRISEGISAVTVLGYGKDQVICTELPFYKKKSRKICAGDSIIIGNVIDNFVPKHIFICCDPDPNKTHINCLNILKNCNINSDTKIWLYKSAWQSWDDCTLSPNIEVCINPSSFKKKLLAIDMHISQHNPAITKNKEICSFKDIVSLRNKSNKFFGQYFEEFYLCTYIQFLNLKNFY